MRPVPRPAGPRRSVRNPGAFPALFRLFHSIADLVDDLLDLRGIVAFLKSTKVDLESGEQADATDMQLMQNKMMFNRIKYQALAIVVVAILLAISR